MVRPIYYLVIPRGISLTHKIKYTFINKLVVCVLPTIGLDPKTRRRPLVASTRMYTCWQHTYTCIGALGVNRIGNRKGIRKEDVNEKGKWLSSSRQPSSH
jgi:hypothetical protein